MKTFTLIAGALASTLLAGAASANIGPHLERRALEAPATTRTEVAVERYRKPAYQPVVPTSYADGATATGGPFGGLPDRN